MELLTLIIAIGFVHVWGADNPLHKDTWLYWWIERVNKLFQNRKSTQTFEAPISSVSDDDFKNKSQVRSWRGVITVAVLAVFALIVVLALSSISHWLVFPFYIVLLLYSFGRGQFTQGLTQYTKACYVEDWESACSAAQSFGLDRSTVLDGDWPTLHRHMFTQAAYKGFEKSFVIIFWFLLLGAVFAFFYRVLFLYSKKYKHDAIAEHVLWVLEWPVVRLMGLSFSLTGNFVGCFIVLKELFFDFQHEAKNLLSQLVIGAFMVDDNISVKTDITRKELHLLSKLYERTLWFWLAIIALEVLVF